MANEFSAAPDAEARQAALAPQHSFIVQAPAGSGKTELLTQRFLALLAQSDWPEEIAAVTFTRKAEAEMRGRIIKTLRATALGDVDELRPESQALAEKALARDRERGWELLANPRRLRIQTFDAWCQRLARQMPYLSGLGGTPPVIEDARPLYAEAARETLNLLETDGPWAQALERLLGHLDNRDQTLQDLLANILARRDHWLRLPTAAGLSRAHLEEALADTLRAHLQTLGSIWPAALTAETLSIANYAAQQLAETGTPSPICGCLGLGGLPGGELSDLPAWLGMAELWLTKTGEWRKTLNKNNGFPADKTPLALDMKQRGLSLLAALAEHDAVRTALDDVRRLPPPGYADPQWEILAALAEVLPVALAQLRLVMLDQGLVDFTEIALAAQQALGTSEEPTDLALHLDYRLRHILVDEFQDTSVTQLRLLEGLTAGWERGDGRSLFLVGDPMQSIYRFRDAEVGIFLRIVEEQVLGGVALTPLRLRANFRSQAGLIGWFNDSFSAVFPALADPQTGAVTYSPVQAVKPAEDEACQIHMVEDVEAEARRVAELAAWALAEDAHGSVGILARRRSDLGPIAAALKAAGLRFRAVETESLAARPVIQDLLALTRVLAHPADRTAWLAVLRAPWCGLDLHDLYALAGEQPEHTIWELIQESEACARLSTAGQSRLARTIAALAPVVQVRRRRPLRDRVEAAWLRLGGPACLEQDADAADMRAYLDALGEIETGAGLSDFARLSERVAKLYATPDPQADERLSLMTIHKAKGLEFDTVILPGLGRGTGRDGSPLLRWRELAAPGGGSRLLLAPISATGGDADLIYDYLKHLEKIQLNHELKRLLYVAATRAKRRLHLLTELSVSDQAPPQVKKPAAGTLLGVLWPVLEPELQGKAEALAPAPSAVTAPEPAPAPASLRRLPVDWQTPAPAADAWVLGSAAPASEDLDAEPEFRWAQLTIRRIGTVIHQWLRGIADEGLASWNAQRIAALGPALRRSLEIEGVASESLQEAVASSQQALSNLLADERGRWIVDDSRHQEARSEWALSGLLGDKVINVVIDRSFLDDQGRRWIIDYKTSQHTGGRLADFLDQEQARYRHQLEVYAAIMAGMEQRPIRLGLYFPLLRAWREWAPGDSGLSSHST